jgi:hypothetical protein
MCLIGSSESLEGLRPRTEPSAIRPIVVVLLGDPEHVHREMACSGWNASIGEVRGHVMVVSSCVHDELASQLFSVTSIDSPVLDLL